MARAVSVPGSELFIRRVPPAERDSARFVLAALSTDAGVRETARTDVDLERLHRFASRNRVAPHAAHLLDERDGPAGSLIHEHEASDARLTSMMGVLDGVATALDREDIPVVALKNAGIARGIFPCAACNPMGDLDLLVRRSDFRRAHGVMLSLGFQLDSRSVVEAPDLESGLESGGLEYVRRLGESEVWIELQWRAVSGRWINADQEPDGDGLIARSERVPGSAVRILDPTENLLQVCLHTAKHSFVRAPGLRLHTDVDRIVRLTRVDWPAFAERVAEQRAETACFFSLALAVSLLNTPVPASVLTELAPPSWKRRVVFGWIARAGIFDPDARKFSRLGMLVFHALLYDDVRGLLSAVTDSGPKDLRARNLPRLSRRTAGRVADLLLRYER